MHRYLMRFYIYGLMVMRVLNAQEDDVRLFELGYVEHIQALIVFG